jgi:hypothetical protein
LDVSENFLAKDRMTKLHGIPFSKCGRLIRYDFDLLDDWLDSRRQV